MASLLDCGDIDFVGHPQSHVDVWTIMDLTFALSLMGDMPTNKARTSDNAQKQSASNAVPISYSVI